jgi:hypothetical protein
MKGEGLVCPVIPVSLSVNNFDAPAGSAFPQRSPAVSQVLRGIEDVNGQHNHGGI